MPRATFRFYAELNGFLAPERRARPFPHTFLDAAPVKDMIESFGVPHTEVDLILANGESVDFSYVVRDGELISVYPMFEALDITPEIKVRPAPLRNPRFVLDTHLGRLARYLRMMGFDTLYVIRHARRRRRSGAHLPRRAPHPAHARCGIAETRHGDARLLRARNRAAKAVAGDRGPLRTGARRASVHALHGVQRCP